MGLFDLVAFYEALEQEMKHMLVSVDEGLPLDSALFECMMTVKGKYMEATHGLYAYDDAHERQRHVRFRRRRSGI